jgi:hypothetical protein
MPKTFALAFAAFLLALASGVAFAQFEQVTTAPTPLRNAPSGAAFDIQVHSRDANTWGDNSLESMQNHHGADCSGPPAVHANTSYAGAVFICNNHVMTSINASGYGEIVITPSQMADWTGGQATIQWEMSTQRQSLRDWPDLWITPWHQNLNLPFDAGDVDNQGVPVNAIHVDLNNSQSAWVLKTVRNGVPSAELNSRISTPPIGSGIAATVNQAAVRQTFRLTVSRTRLRLERVSSSTAPGAVYFDGNVPDLGFTQGVVQFAHHSYNPTKDGAGAPATWHWGEMAISPAAAFTVIKTHTRALFQNGSVTFDAPAPANSWLRFTAVGSVQYSVNGGTTYQNASKQAFVGHPEHASPYFLPVPQGTQTVLFRLSADSWYQGPFHAKDFAIWSRSASTQLPPAASPTPPAPTPTRPPSTPTPSSATATPTPGLATWTTNAMVSRSTIVAGQTQRVSVTVTASRSTNALVLTQIYNAAGQKIWEAVRDNQSFSAGTPRTFQSDWVVPQGTAAGDHVVKVGIFSPGWGTMWSWTDSAVTFRIN